VSVLAQVYDSKQCLNGHTGCRDYSNFSQVSQRKGRTTTEKQPITHKNSNVSTAMLFIYAVKAEVTFRQLLPTEKAAC